MSEFDKSFTPVASSGEGQPLDASSRLSSTVEHWHKPFFILFLISCVVNLALLWLQIELSPDFRWLEGVFLLCAAITSLLALGRRLPVQNVVMAAAVIMVISGGVIGVGTMTGVPFGPFVYSEALGEKIFNVLPWSIPLIWIVIVINSPGVARLMMRPWRKTNFYGFWVIGLTCLLAVILDLGLEPFAVYVKNYWVWRMPDSVAAWYSAPWINFLGWFVATLAILVFATPWLINKQPIKRPIDYHPLITWLLLNAWFMAGNGVKHLWPAVGLSLISCVFVATYAIRGARW